MSPITEKSRRKSGAKKEETTKVAGKCTLRSLIICTIRKNVENKSKEYLIGEEHSMRWRMYIEL
jgi:hypothetical protein